MEIDHGHCVIVVHQQMIVICMRKTFPWDDIIMNDLVKEFVTIQEKVVQLLSVY